MRERLVVVGGDAGGMAAASQARRRRPDLEIVALEKGRWTSYSACGIPFVVGGEVESIERLVARSPETFRSQFDIDARTEHEVMAIDLDRREVEVRDLAQRSTYRLGFDLLQVATGAIPARPPVPGADLPCVHGVQTLEDAATLLAHAEEEDVRHVVVVGGGYIGLEMAEAFVHRGLVVTVVEAAPEVMATLDADMGRMVADAMRAMGIVVRVGVAVTAIEEHAVHTANGRIDADLVVLGTGVKPNTTIAAAAGLETGVRGALRVDDRQRTSAAGVWSAGDCCESVHLVTGERVHIALGTVANKQGRVAGINIGGGDVRFPGVVGTAVSKVCSTEIARTGLSVREAEAAGIEHVAVTIESTTRAGYYPGAAPITVKVVAARGSGRVLGAQIVGREGAAKRIDVFAVAITAGLTAAQMVDLDLSYAPPFAPVWDPVLIGARKAAEAVDADGSGSSSA